MGFCCKTFFLGGIAVFSVSGCACVIKIGDPIKNPKKSIAFLVKAMFSDGFLVVSKMVWCPSVLTNCLTPTLTCRCQEDPRGLSKAAKSINKWSLTGGPHGTASGILG